MGSATVLASKLQSLLHYRHLEGKTCSLLEKIARLGYGLAANHAFIDGNKRIGAMMTQLLLKWNGFQLKLQTGELSEMFIAIADGRADEEALLLWLQKHID